MTERRFVIQIPESKLPGGALTITTTAHGVSSVDFSRLGAVRPPETDLELETADLLISYFAGRRPDFSGLPLDWSNTTAFQRKVWQALMKIPYGEVRSYSWLAEAAGSPGGFRAVGQANGRNPVPIIVPCHRVVAKDGGLGGFMRGAVDGLTLKQALLALEGCAVQDGRVKQPVAMAV
jgi:methylated-DNA-[protein]-cysteine S-methyltransferase